MSKRLEDFVTSNRQAFDVYKPKPTLWDAISKNVVKKRSLVLKIVPYAAAILLFSFGFLLGRQNNSGMLSQCHLIKKVENTQETEKLIESEFYYANQINDRMKKLEVYFANDPQLKQDLEVDFNALDKYYEELKKDLGDNVDNEHVIEAMVQSYQMKLKILEGLLIQLNKNNYEANKCEI